jgi:hypothetical protein
MFGSLRTPGSNGAAERVTSISETAPHERRRLSDIRERKFPNLLLHPENYEVKSLETEDYNCAAWAVDVTDLGRWWPHPDDPTYYWPAGARRDDTLQAFIEGYAKFRYTVCASPDYEVGFEKIVVYADGDEPRHIARQLPNGRWSSKLGDWEDIEHLSLDDVSSDDYGRPSLFLRRPHVRQ